MTSNTEFDDSLLVQLIPHNQSNGRWSEMPSLIARCMGPTWGPRWAPWTLLSGMTLLHHCNDDPVRPILSSAMVVPPPLTCTPWWCQLHTIEPWFPKWPLAKFSINVLLQATNEVPRKMDTIYKRINPLLGQSCSMLRYQTHANFKFTRNFQICQLFQSMALCKTVPTLVRGVATVSHGQPLI